MTLSWVPYVMCVMGGRLLDSSGTITEGWQSTYKCGYQTGGGTGGVVAPKAFTDGAVIALQAAHKTFIASGSGVVTSFTFSGDVRLDYLKMNAIGSDGHYANAGTSQFLYGASFGAGINAGPRMYWRTSFVMSSTTSSAAAGRGAFGRSYMPPGDTGANAAAIGPYIGNASSLAALLTNWKTLMTAVAAFRGTGGDKMFPCHYSPGDSVKGTTPIVYNVTGYRVNAIPGNQRTRTNKAPAKYTTITFP